jgi:pyruvate formate lyase activating enzyme
MPYQHTLKDNKLQCLICPRNCKLAQGQQGFCGIRQNIKGNIDLTSYGYTTGLALDPIEKKPLYHFLPGSKVLSFGTLGCNMGCMFCQNWHMSKSKENPKSGQKASPEEIALLAKQEKCKSVAFTYNDPIIFFEYAIDTAIECHKLGLKTVAVTAGYINPKPREEFFKHMDAANIDLKAFNKEFYKKLCLANIEPVLDTIKYVKNETDCHLELTTLLIEGHNSSPKEIAEECDWIAKNIGVDTPIHFSAFFPAYKLQNVPPTNPKTLFMAYEIAKKAGLRYAYTGNIIDETGSTTHCHGCKKALIKRSSYVLSEYNLKTGGICKFCGTKCSGIFE